jgi:hypothetical protein
MFGRATWLGVGLVAGLGTSKWVERRMRRRLARYLPASQLPLRAGTEVADRARALAVGKVADLRSAIEEGRSAMAAREVELRRQLHLAERSGSHPVGPGGARRSGEPRGAAGAGAARGARGARTARPA